MRKYFADLKLALQNLLSQKTRTLLTAMGIIFGVGMAVGAVNFMAWLFP